MRDAVGSLLTEMFSAFAPLRNGQHSVVVFYFHRFASF